MQSLEPLSYFFGAFLGDGYAGNVRSHYKVDISNLDKEIIERCYFSIAYYFTDLRRGRLYTQILPSRKTLYRVVWHSRDFCELVKSAVGDKEKFPDYIWNASRVAKLDMLAGLMDTDGSISKNGRGSYNINFVGGKPFVKYFELLCNSVGIEIGSVNLNSNTNPCYVFTLLKNSVEKSGFKFGVRRKQARLNAWLNGVYNAIPYHEPG